MIQLTSPDRLARTVTMLSSSLSIPRRKFRNISCRHMYDSWGRPDSEEERLLVVLDSESKIAIALEAASPGA